MKRNIVLVFCILFLSVLICSPTLLAQDQSPSTIYVEVDYMKAKSGEYVALEKDIWKALHQERIKNGDIVGWYLYSVRFPYGEGVKYDYVTVTIYDDLAKLEEPYKDFEAWVKKVHPDMDVNKLNEKTSASRDLVWGEVFTIIDEAVPGPLNPPAQFIAVNFMAVDQGKGADYVKMEQEIFKPLHAAMVEAGDIQDWILLSCMAPQGDDYEYQYTTVDVYGSWENYGKNSMAKAWEKVHPDKDINDYFEKTAQTRTLKRKETWQLLDYIMAGDIASNE